jgi:hypothetical protein
MYLCSRLERLVKVDDYIFLFLKHTRLQEPCKYSQRWFCKSRSHKGLIPGTNVRKIYQNWNKIPNRHELQQIFHPNNFQNIPTLPFWVWKYLYHLATLFKNMLLIVYISSSDSDTDWRARSVWGKCDGPQPHFRGVRACLWWHVRLERRKYFFFFFFYGQPKDPRCRRSPGKVRPLR